MRPRIAIVGGGLAGLAAAIACADAGASVVLYEARPRLGGATWSTRRGGLTIDNGQHVFMRCFHAYRQFLERLGVSDKVHLQDRLAVRVIDPRGRSGWLRRKNLRPPFHLAASLARYTHLRPAERLGVARGARQLAALDLADAALDDIRFGDWLRHQRQTQNAISVFWDLIVRPTLNLAAPDASLALAAKVFQTGFLSEAGAADLGYPTVPLDELHAVPAQRSLERVRAQVHLRAQVTGIETSGPKPVVVLGARRSESDAVILAVPHEDAARLLPATARVDPARLRRLGRSPIVNLHVLYDRPVMPFAFAAGVGTPLQWVFDRSEIAGTERGRYLAVSLSAADEFVGLASAELQQRFEPELQRLLPAARAARIDWFGVTTEPVATFRQVPGTRRLRPSTHTADPRLFLAGAWTQTGWPATMEGAVRSGRSAARAALLAVGRTRDLPEMAA